MSDLHFVATAQAPQAIGPYSQGVIAGGVLYTAGQVALDPATMALVAGDVKAQTVFLATMDDFAAMNEVYARHFGAHKPARSTVAVQTLPKNALVEIDCVAVL